MKHENQIPYFEYRMGALQHFLNRFPNGIDFKGKRVLDLGCGHGALAITAALAGASEVVGIDIHTESIEFAHEIQSARYPETSANLSFQECNLLTHDATSESSLGQFDILLSEDTFEHVVELESFIGKAKDLLVDGGKLYTGYSPLYNAPWGDHRRLKAPLQKFFPWAHLMFPQRWLLRRLDTKDSLDGQQPQSLADIGLNGLSFAEHKRILHSASGMNVIFFQANNKSRPLVRAIDYLRVIPGLRELLSISIHAILQKPPA